MNDEFSEIDVLRLDPGEQLVQLRLDLFAQGGFSFRGDDVLVILASRGS